MNYYGFSSHTVHEKTERISYRASKKYNFVTNAPTEHKNFLKAWHFKAIKCTV